MQVFKVVLQRTEMEIGRVQKLVTFLCLFGAMKRLAGPSSGAEPVFADNRRIEQWRNSLPSRKTL